jgi:hypothetical protein
MVMWGGRGYGLADGTQTPVRCQLGWCHDCAGLSCIEDRDWGALEFSIAERRRRIERLEWDIAARPRGIRRFVTTSKALQRFVRELEHEHETFVQECRRWQVLRTGLPARCLKCGSARVERVDAALAHPGCGGTFRTELARLQFNVAFRVRIHGVDGRWLTVDPAR